MNASEITKQIQGQVTLRGYNLQLINEGQPKSRYDLSNCCGFFDPSSCSWDISQNFFPPSFQSYELRDIVNQGLVANGCISTNTVSITKQSVVVCPAVVYTVPLGNVS